METPESVASWSECMWPGKPRACVNTRKTKSQEVGKMYVIRNVSKVGLGQRGMQRRS